MNQHLEKLQKLKGLLNLSNVGFLLAFVFFLIMLNYLTAAQELRSQIGNLSAELLNRKSEIDRLQSELDQTGQKNKEMETQLAAGNEKSTQDQTKITDLEAISKKFSDLTSVLDSAKLKMLSLTAMEAGSKAQAKFFWTPGNKSAGLLVSGLSSSVDSQEYQVWLTQPGAVNVKLVAFAVESSELKFFKLEDFSIPDSKKSSTIAVTRESKGGSSIKPTNPKVLSGKL